MAANTGPSLNTYQIPEVELVDTFNVWRDITNTQTFKLNKLKVYDGLSSSSINFTLSDGGTFDVQIADNVDKGVTFIQPVVFSSGVTFNGDVTFNAQTFTVNANNVTIDDYAIVLGATPGTNDTHINSAGGGGLLLNRGGAGDTAAWLWRSVSVQGLTGIWSSNAHIGLCGASAGLYPHNGSVLPIHGTGLRLDGNAVDSHGLQIDLTNGTGANSKISLSRYSPSGSTGFAEVLNGTTYGNRPFFNVKDGANRKTITQNGSGALVFGTPVRYNGTQYVAAQADNSENAEVVGIVSARNGSNEFELTFIGEIFGNFSSVLDDGGSLVPGQTYYLSPRSSGKITSTQPTAAGSVHKALFVATGTNSAIVIPFTGGLLTSTLTVSTASSVATRISQLNKFNIGDIVRFRKPGPNGTTLAYVLSDQVVQRHYSDGTYVKAQANSEADATVAGMVVGKDAIIVGSAYDAQTNPGDAVWGEFDVLMDGWFDNLTGLNTGEEYWLAVGAAGTPPVNQPSGTFNCLESTNPSYATDAPSGQNQVRKRLFMATSSTGGYLYSYRGDVNNPQTTQISSITVQDALIRDLRSSVQNDLKIGVFNNSQLGGYPAIQISTAPTTSIGAGSTLGNVGIGNTNWTVFNNASDGNRILATLDVAGSMRVGTPFSSGAIPGQDLLVSRDETDKKSDGFTASSRAVIGQEYNTGNIVLGYRVRPSRTAAEQYISSSRNGTFDRSALVIGTDSVSGVPTFKWKMANDFNSTANGSVTLTDVLNIQGTSTPQTTLSGNFSLSGNLAVDTSTLFVNSSTDRVGIGTSSPIVTLDVNGLARCNVSATQITEMQHLTTKEYVDSRSTITYGSSIAASGASVTYTGIPSGVRRITIMCDRISVTASKGFIMRVGSSQGIFNRHFL